MKKKKKKKNKKLKIKIYFCFFFNDPAPPEFYTNLNTLSLHDALPIFVAQLGFAPTIYYRGTGVDLGFPLEFRSSVELAYRFDDRSRLGAQIYHLSNASLGWQNPGTEVLMLSYSVPITRFTGKK